MLKCGKCRKMLFSEKEISDSHGEAIPVGKVPVCASNLFFLRQDILPAWVKAQVDKGDWVKGKLFCPSCNCRIGSFNFTSGSKCPCGLCLVPALHVTSTKLDRQECLEELTLTSHDRGSQPDYLKECLEEEIALASQGPSIPDYLQECLEEEIALASQEKSKASQAEKISSTEYVLI